MSFYIYIVRCKDNSLYTGFTLDINKRVQEHNNSKLGAKAIKGKLPAVLVYSEKFDSKLDALKREREIKSWDKKKKEELIANAI